MNEHEQSATREAAQTERNVWPRFPLSGWKETGDTLLQYAQVVGKVRLALEPMRNHWWQVPFYLSSRGLTTSVMHIGGGQGIEITFDFLDHKLRLSRTDGEDRNITLEARSVASFYEETMSHLADLGVTVELLARPVEVELSVPFSQNTDPSPYDPVAAHQFFLVLLQSHRVMTAFRSRFIGKASAVHYFWGGGDLATTRFSGRRAPKHPGGVPNCADWVQELAYSHEVSSCGFWPGGSAEGLFYAYAYPEPPGFSEWKVEPTSAYYDAAFGEFILPYEAVRANDDPDAALLDFFQGTYEAAAELGHWDRGELEAEES